MTEHVTKEERFAEILEAGKHEQKPVFLKFGATWCGPCKAIAPKFDALAKKHQAQGFFVSIDVDDLPDVASTFKVSSIPRFIVVKNLKVADSWMGANAPILEQHVVKHCVRSN
jgi:thioredoxin 1